MTASRCRSIPKSAYQPSWRGGLTRASATRPLRRLTHERRKRRGGPGSVRRRRSPATVAEVVAVAARAVLVATVRQEGHKPWGGVATLAMPLPPLLRSCRRSRQNAADVRRRLGFARWRFQTGAACLAVRLAARLLPLPAATQSVNPANCAERQRAGVSFRGWKVGGGGVRRSAQLITWVSGLCIPRSTHQAVERTIAPAFTDQSVPLWRKEYMYVLVHNNSGAGWGGVGGHAQTAALLPERFGSVMEL